MTKAIILATILVMQATLTLAQLNLSPVNTGDCVSDRIASKRTPYMDEYYRKYCAQNKNKALERKCIENTKGETEFSFFTDRCSEKDYFIGINGEELRLKKTSKLQPKQHLFIGTYSGTGIRVLINNPRKVKETSAGATQDEFEGGSYKVDVTVTKGALTKNFKDVVLMYGL